MGLLITVEGGEYVGKTSLVVPALKTFLEAAGIETITSREPGGTLEGEKIREKIFKRLKEGATAKELTLLFNEARRIHLDTIIIPFLGQNKEKGRVVILDRYLDSTRVYQGLEGGVPLTEIKALENQYVKGYYPDITFILYFPEEVFKKVFYVRKHYALSHLPSVKKRSLTDWDAASVEKHLIRQRYYLKLPRLAAKLGEKRRFFLINAARRPSEVVQEVVFKCAPLILRDKTILAKVKTSKELLLLFEQMKKKRLLKNMENLWLNQQNSLKFDKYQKN